MKEKTKFDKFATEIEKIRGAAVYGEEDLLEENDEDDLPYVELGIITQEFIDKAKEIISKYGYYVYDESECEGSDYPSYCIWFAVSNNN